MPQMLPISEGFLLVDPLCDFPSCMWNFLRFSILPVDFLCGFPFCLWILSVIFHFSCGSSLWFSILPVDPFQGFPFCHFEASLSHCPQTTEVQPVGISRTEASPTTSAAWVGHNPLAPPVKPCLGTNIQEKGVVEHPGGITL